MNEDQNKQPFIFIVDDIEENLQVLGNILFASDFEVTMANNGTEALDILNWQELPDLILLDVMMPDIDGFEVCAKLKEDPRVANIPVIFLTAKAEPESIVMGFKSGGVDYITKPFQREELMARINTHLELKFSREALLKKSRELEKVNSKLRESEMQLMQYNKELEEVNNINKKFLERIESDIENASNYVRSLIPEEIKKDNLETFWKFEPSEKLGGDIFGYHYSDDDNFVIYLIDVCGHGIDATLHAVSVINTIRYRTLGGIDYNDPAQVLSKLNDIYQISPKSPLYFTAWYAVINLQTKEMKYCGAGHPPAILFAGNNIVELDSKSMMIGGMPNTKYENSFQKLHENDFFYLYSDGVYEFKAKNGENFDYTMLLNFLNNVDRNTNKELDLLFAHVNELNIEEALKDDFSILKVAIH